MESKKVAVICGAGAMGLANAKALAEAGLRIVVLDEDKAKAQSVIDALPEEAKGFAEVYHPLCEASMKEAVAKVEAAYGRLDALVNNDLEMTRRLNKEISAENFSHAMDRNARAMFLMARAAIAVMAKNGGGRVVNMSSVHSHVGDGYHMEYAASTSAINAVTRELATGYWKDNIQVNTCMTCFVDGQFPDELDMDQRQEPERISLLGRRVTPDDVAKTVRFLVTCKTKCVNASEIRADAGYLPTQYRVGDVPFVKLHADT